MDIVFSFSNLTFAIVISQRSANTAFFADLDRKRVHNLPKRADIHQYKVRNGTTLTSIYKIALVIEKTVQSVEQSKRNKF